MPKIHLRLGTRAEGVAFLCKNWDARRRKVANDVLLDSPLRQALRQSTHEESEVTCPKCLKLCSQEHDS